MRCLAGTATVAIFVVSVIADIQRISKEFTDIYPMTMKVLAPNTKDINHIILLNLKPQTAYFDRPGKYSISISTASE